MSSGNGTTICLSAELGRFQVDPSQVGLQYIGRYRFREMADSNDNRMRWIRNGEALQGACQRYTIEYELGSDCRIPGLLDYEKAKIICGPLTIDESRNGLFLYNLVAQYPLGPQPNIRADDKGYYFKEGILGEIIALMSLHFRCRFYLISSRCLPDDPTRGMTIKREYDILHKRCDFVIHPPIFAK